MMRNIIATLLLVLLSVSPSFAGKVFDKIIASGEIRCGYAMSPPALVKDPNTAELSGLDYDIWREIGKELDLEIVWAEEAGWGSYIAGLNSGRYDVFCNQAWPNPGRLKNSTMVGPVTYQTLWAYARKDDTRFDGNIDRINMDDIAIPAIDGDVSVSMAKNKFPNARLDTLPQMATVSEMFMSVTSGKSDVMFLDEAFYKILSKENPDVLRMVPDVDPVFVYGSFYSVKRGEQELKDMIQIALRRIIDDGRMKAIAHSYSSSYHIPLKNYE